MFVRGPDFPTIVLDWSLQIKVKLFLMVTFILLHFYPKGSAHFPVDNFCIHMVTEWFNVWKWCDSYKAI